MGNTQRRQKKTVKLREKIGIFEKEKAICSVKSSGVYC